MRVIAGCFAAALVTLALAATAIGHATAPAVVKVVKTKSLGKVVANDKGKTLYLFRADSGPKSACYGQCAKYWPPLLTTGKPVATDGVKAALLGTAKRKDGTIQVTYKGHPLYTFAEDTKVGMTTGEGSDGFGAKWYALAPSGSTIDKD
jgi:predicted lipoprotein with Yx(FWY)xxD motif